MTTRDEFQAALNDGLLDLRGRPGPHVIDIPPWPRPIGTLTMPDGARIIGDGATIVFMGNPMDHDWAGVRAGNDWKITGVNFVVDEPSGIWDEQSHVLEVVGPAIDGELSYCTFDHPLVNDAGSPRGRGDCIRFRGYPPAADGSADRRIRNQHIHHCQFLRSARSGVAIYGGVHDSRFHHLTLNRIPDQDLDCEGSQGDIVNVEWGHNIHHTGPLVQSAIAVSLYPGSVNFHHNQLDGRGLHIMGGSHHVHHNVITQTVRTDDPVVYVRKGGSCYFHDERWTRSESAGRGAVFVAAQKISAPTDVVLKDVELVQMTPAITLGVSGVAGISIIDCQISDTGGPGLRDAIRIEGTGLTRTTPVLVAGCEFLGSMRAAVSVSGSYLGGVGSVEVRDCIALQAQAVLRQENIEVTAKNGGIAGPVVEVDNRVVP